MLYGSAISWKWMVQEQKFDGQLNLNHPKINLRGAFMPYAFEILFFAGTIGGIL